MSRYEFQMGPTVWYGKYSLRKLYSLSFKKVCIVTDKSMVALEMLKPLERILKDLHVTYRIFDEVEPDPSLDTILSGLSHILVTKPDLLIAVGGGSVIDAAKAIMFFCLKVKEDVLKPEKIVKPFFVAVPTTSGTGSEVTSYSVITDTKKGVKIPLKDARMLPDVAVLDPIFTSTLPKKVIASAGLDVFTHAIEAYVSKEHHVMSDLYSLEAVKLASGALPAMYEDVSKDTARMDVHLASFYAGLAFENSGLGLNHGMAHALGARHKIPHGLANAMLLLQIIRFNRQEEVYGEETGKRYDTLAKAMVFRTSPLCEAEGILEKIRRLKVFLDVPDSLKALGIPEKDFMDSIPSMVKNALADFTTGSSPRKPKPEEVVRLYLEAYYGL